MSKIKVLDDHLTNMIAAGEVVERPAGIIKELIENSIDANASEIEIRIEEGGMNLIEVKDNGDGMGKDDLVLAFNRHSTSKISTANDLNAISSFGFRGEALPSIASVTHLSATSHDGSAGHVIEFNHGERIHFARIARNKGTSIRINQLFLKTPARLKHIKSIQYETSIITDTIQKFSLAHPDIAFSFYNENKLNFRSFGNGDLKEAFHRIYGNAISKDSIEFETSNYDFKISGVMALPMHSRSNRNAINLFINDRMIRFPKVQRAVSDAYRRHMPSDRFPIVVMNIEVDPQLVDVNVHPSKWEVRLSKDKVLIELILNYFESRLSEEMRPQRMVFKEKEIVEQQSFKEDLLNERIFPAEVEEASALPASFSSFERKEENELPQVDKETSFIEVETLKEEIIEKVESESGKIEPLKVLSQMSGKYILAQGDLGLYIIDQHAAMERIRYEYYQDRLLDQNHPEQMLLMPHVIEGRKSLVGRIDEVNAVLKQFQIELDVLDEDSLILRSMPMWMKEKELNEFLTEVLDGFEDEKNISEEDFRSLGLATLACHSSVRFNEYLSMPEMIALVEDLRACRQAYHCPHGRPTFLSVEHTQLIKEFKR